MRSQISANLLTVNSQQLTIQIRIDESNPTIAIAQPNAARKQKCDRVEFQK